MVFTLTLIRLIPRPAPSCLYWKQKARCSRPGNVSFAKSDPTLWLWYVPLQGKVSDIHGRKTMLLASYIGPAVGYFATGISGSLLVLILARIPTGKVSLRETN